MIYYAVTPTWSTITRYAKEKDFIKVYDIVSFITHNPYEAQSASSWCELASVGEVYEHEEFKIEIIED